MKTFDGLEEHIRDHVKLIAKTSGLSLNDETYELMANAWVEKKELFEAAISANNLEEVSFFGKNEEKGALVLTYSGSLLNIGPLIGNVRHCEYTSIGLRVDVPASATEEASALAADLETDAVAEFSRGPIKKSSPIFKIAVTQDTLAPEEEAEMLTQVSQGIVEDFVEVNKTVIQ